jgi:hypothetical protein
MAASEQTYRLYNCARCAEQVRICRRCDRGNQYCAGECAGLRRRESLLRAGRRYQRSYRGACAHAARQSAWRKSQAQKVTHQGCLRNAVTIIVTPSSTQGTHGDIALFEAQPHGTPPVVLDLAEPHVHAACHAHRMAVSMCSFCRGTLPSFARLGALRAGP